MSCRASILISKMHVGGHPMKNLLIVFGLSLALLGCAPSTNNTPNTPTPVNPNPPAEELEVITLDELATFDGQDGRFAYVAIDGLVYDVTGIPAWNGGHQGLQPGADLTEAIERSPHGRSVLNGLRVVGKLE
jgi:predicted heme/steroid binding protein